LCQGNRPTILARKEPNVVCWRTDEPARNP
jgi:hypothetical protein